MLLSELDNLYKTTVSKLPKEQRLWYCTRHLDKLQFMLSDNPKMKVSQKKSMEKMIEALMKEIQTLSEKTDF